ncbi:GAF domain-containing protein [Amycolatopsis marina]|uniref:GAF domain-containing protein n=1 Tax=Amycolatopsis marina TaxID=490629 RepID=A0A1I0X2R6_9PSEU|nr:GAF and ANTAR domain-containing protein [Amycolatopsis marina]SFA94710.1 GAF domain-containing protein [Amycolatopsis marina]
MTGYDAGEASRWRGQLDEVAGALESLTAALDSEDELDSVLKSVCHQVTHVVHGADMASITVLRDGVATTVASTDQRAVDLDDGQYRAGAGPCLRAAATGETVRVHVQQAAALWPSFTKAAIRLGVESYLSAPFAMAQDSKGALNLFGFQSHGFDEVEEKLLGLYARAVESALRSNARYLLFRKLAEQLQDALASRAVIDQAKGILMATLGVTADEAFNELVQRSQRENVKLHDVAEAFVASARDKARAAAPN